MKIWELSCGLQILLSEEENQLLDNFLKDDNYDLSEREKMVAQQLVNKDILIRENDDDQEYYHVNYKTDVWRD